MYVIFLESRSKLSDHLNRVLNAEALSCFSLYNYEDLESYFANQTLPVPDAIVLDQDFELRTATRTIPVLKEKWPMAKLMVLAEVPGAKERVRLLRLGADDCMTKPIDVEELLVRLQILYRRLRQSQNESQWGREVNVLLDDKVKDLIVDGERLKLNNKEYLLAETFYNHPGKVFSRLILLDIAWGIQSDVESNVVEATVSSLRRKLEKSRADLTIKSRRNVGYWAEEIGNQDNSN
ncbi:MAG: response regulator transcription factor [Bdellovibrionaceae bacterium]|nr:response regulator transcription factor [Bdellovibrionales bacterium]MCB9083210.1 response regulator transcription factor [Pseudobdellovibrionaceae bacterium]